MIPTFIDLRPEEQCEELRQYLIEQGAEIGLEKSNRGLIGDLDEIIRVIEFSFKDEKDENVESVLNSVVSLLIQVPHNDPACRALIVNFCRKVTQIPTNRHANVAQRVLTNLLEGVGENVILRYDVFVTLVNLTGRSNQIGLVFSDVKKVKQKFSPEIIGIDKFQDLFRLLHEMLILNHQSDQASKVMIELLSTYSEQTASQARVDAQKCIIATLADPNTFLMDHLLTLKPVKVLEGEQIHVLLNIFVSEKLNSYLAFYESNKNFVDSIGLKHEQNIKKMRLLTFMQMAETKKELSFDVIKQELQLNEDAVESFIIDVLKTKLVRAKIDQLNRKVTVSSTMHRTFGKQQWTQLKETLSIWSNNMQKVQASINTAIHASAN